jgi:hypothetical protein
MGIRWLLSNQSSIESSSRGPRRAGKLGPVRLLRGQFRVNAMVLPERVDLQLKCTSPIGLEAIIVQMTVTSGTKTPFHILFPKTAKDGSSSLSAEDFAGQFTDHYAMGLMDYDGSIATASQDVSIVLFDPNQLLASIDLVRAWPLLPYESRRWTSREEVISYLLSSRNPLFAAQPLIVHLERGIPIIYSINLRAA